MSESLQAALARMAIFRTSSDAFLTFGKEDMNILTINPAAESMFGHHGTDLFGRQIGMLFSPQGVAADEALPAQLLDGSAQETMACRADGSMFPAEVVITDVHLGEQRFYVANVRDISDRKRAEESLRDSEAGFRAAVEELQTNARDDVIEIDHDEELVRQARAEWTRRAPGALYRELRNAWRSYRRRRARRRGLKASS